MEIPSEWEMLGLVALAALLGGLIGLERQSVGKTAGLRTYALVASAAAMLTSIGMRLVSEYNELFTENLLQSDPIRVIQATIIGISFIGAGVIAKKEDTGEPRNLTTAASLLVASTIGIAVAARAFWLASGVTLLVLVVNEGFYRLGTWGLFEKLDQTKKA